MDPKHDIELTLDQMKTVAACLLASIHATGRSIQENGKRHTAGWHNVMAKRQALEGEAYTLILARIEELEPEEEDDGEADSSGCSMRQIHDEP